MSAEFMSALRSVYEEDPPAVLSEPHSKRSSSYEKLKKMRLVWDRREDKSLPFNFSFVLEGQVAGMALPTSKDQLLRLSRDHSVGMVCSLLEEENVPHTAMFDLSEEQDTKIEHYFLEWRDMGSPDSSKIEKMLAVVKAFIDRTNRAVVFHCYAGKGRTGTAIAAYLIKYHGLTGQQAIEKVRSIRPGSVETREQERWLVNYYNSLHPDRTPEEYLEPSRLSRAIPPQ